MGEVEVLQIYREEGFKPHMIINNFVSRNS